MSALANAKTILTGVKPTGAQHIGNYIGAIRPALRLAQEHGRSYLFIADYHALNAVHDPKVLREDSYQVAACWLALGLNPEKTVLYRQSDIPEIPELVTLLCAVTPKGLMDRSHAYKASVDKNVADGKDADADVNMGLYTYPILMAADILVAQTDIVPVGKDQVQHIEFTRDMAGYFNREFKTNVFKLPNYQLESGVAGALLPGIDGRKMSKSYGNHIPIFIDSAARRKLVMKIVTDSRRPEEPMNPDDVDNNVIFQLYSQFAMPDETMAMRDAFTKGGMGYGDAKQKLYDVLERSFEAPTKIYNDYMANRKKLDDILEAGAARARVIARETLSRAREAVGLIPLVSQVIPTKEKSKITVERTRTYRKRAVGKSFMEIEMKKVPNSRKYIAKSTLVKAKKVKGGSLIRDGRTGEMVKPRGGNEKRSNLTKGVEHKK